MGEDGQSRLKRPKMVIVAIAAIVILSLVLVIVTSDSISLDDFGGWGSYDEPGTVTITVQNENEPSTVSIYADGELMETFRLEKGESRTVHYDVDRIVRWLVTAGSERGGYDDAGPGSTLTFTV